MLIVLIISFLISLLITFTIYLETYDSYNYVGLVSDKEIIVDIPINEVLSIVNSDYLKIDKQKYQFSILNISDIKYNEIYNLNYQTITLSTSGYFKDNLSLNITFYGNKQRIIKKVLKILK